MSDIFNYGLFVLAVIAFPAGYYMGLRHGARVGARTAVELIQREFSNDE